MWRIAMLRYLHIIYGPVQSTLFYFHQLSKTQLNLSYSMFYIPSKDHHNKQFVYTVYQILCVGSFFSQFASGDLGLVYDN
jgi:hypothetical protein